MNNPDDQERRKYAALAFALGVARGTLSGIADGDYTREDAQRIYDATAASRIAQSLGLPDDALDVYWDAYLTDAEKHKIAGHDNAA
jgi:hypothetical protein